ncbi:MAG: hypothetical protein BXU00_03460 [Candidatus Nanoclepta minutus]|uniref:Signal peptidase I n=1 Tax=Candidatus Nanoclepta minutus TaxID=1940235 RepID=A0A397WNA1_9ARCH|nr:MAG: hypothetical protein BXU00_03460 [Candidatus Nanoclepta minutus]
MSGGSTIKDIINKLISLLKFVFFGKGWKSDLAFAVFIILILSIIQISYPYLLSVVYTNSMEHRDFDCNRYLDFNITCDMFNSFPFKNGINVGDIVIVIPSDYRNVKVGDVVVYITPLRYPVLHRVIYKNESYVCIRGDNNAGFLPWECPLYNQKAIVGKAVFRIPYLGYIRIFISRILKI